VFNVEESDDAYPQVVLLQETPAEELRDKVMAAARYCPNHVITVTEV
jgi:ferredoxin